jgi:hypothetical protein
MTRLRTVATAAIRRMWTKRRVGAAVLLAAPLALLGGSASAQAQAPAPVAGLAQRFAPIDLTGTWVSIVTEDWHLRMIAPPPGDFEGLPLTQAAQDAAKATDMAQVAAAGRACEAYGAPMIMREPGRVRISWENSDTLRIDTDAGQQTRRFYFANAPAPGAPSLQGRSIAEWDYANRFDPRRAAQAQANPGQGGGGGRGRGNVATEPTGGKLKVVTTNLTSGFLRKNGVPYSSNTVVTEYYNLFTEPNGTRWFVVTTRIHDPENLVVDYIHSTNFRREPDDSRWDPTPCSLR